MDFFALQMLTNKRSTLKVDNLLMIMSSVGMIAIRSVAVVTEQAPNNVSLHVQMKATANSNPNEQSVES